MNKTVVTLGLALVSACCAVQAQVYPAKLVKVVVPYPPGGAVDVATRQVAQKLAEQMGQSFVVENKPGASGLIGVDPPVTSDLPGTRSSRGIPRA